MPILGDAMLGEGRRPADDFRPSAAKWERISVAWWPASAVGRPVMEGSPRLLAVEDGGRHFWVTVVVVWPTDARGALSKERFAAGDFPVLPWVLDEAALGMLRRRHEEFPVGMHDLSVRVHDMAPCRDNVLRKCVENERLDAVVGRVGSGVAEAEGWIRRRFV